MATRRRKRPIKTRGGARTGTGPKAIFREKTVRFAVRLTTHAHALVQAVAARLACTASDAAEWLIRTGAGERPKDDR